MLSPSPHVEDEAWEYLLDLLLEGEIDTAEFRQQAAGAGYCVEQINNAIDFNWNEIAVMMPKETERSQLLIGSILGATECKTCRATLFFDGKCHNVFCLPAKGGPTDPDPDRSYCKPDQSCCDFCCGN